MKKTIKRTIKLLLVPIFALIISCAPSENDWHAAAARAGAQSSYIDKNGNRSESKRVGDKVVIKHYDSKGREIKGLEKQMN